MEKKTELEAMGKRAFALFPICAPSSEMNDLRVEATVKVENVEAVRKAVYRFACELKMLTGKDTRKSINFFLDDN